MRAVGIICEYNPFHYGHRYHIEQTKKIKENSVVVCVMSGHFVQRGEPAILSKWERTEVALKNGVDLVIELPFPYAVESAAYFAKGAIDTLALADVADIVFGSETNDMEALKQIALQMTQSIDKKQGMSTVQTYEATYGKQLPNDILGACYIKACEPYGIRPHTIKRTNSYHDITLDHTFASASALRHALYHRQDVSAYTPMCINSSDLHHMETYYPLIQSLLITLPADYLHSLFLMDEGIEHRLKEMADRYDTWDEFLHGATSKRYTASNIRRTLIHLLHQTTKQEINALPTLRHIRILGFNQTGQAYLRELKKRNDTIIATTFAQIPIEYRELTYRSAQVYGLYHNRKEVLKQELQPPITL